MLLLLITVSTRSEGKIVKQRKILVTCCCLKELKVSYCSVCSLADPVACLVQNEFRGSENTENAEGVV